MHDTASRDSNHFNEYWRGYPHDIPELPRSFLRTAYLAAAAPRMEMLCFSM